MSKRIVSILLAIVMVSVLLPGNSGGNVQAATSTRASQVITALGILNTDDPTDTSTKTGVTRAQFAQMLVHMSSYRDMVSQSSNVSLFKDVSKKHWAASYIKVAITEGWMSGYLNGTFKPSKNITLQEAVNAVVKVLGYADTDFSGNKNAAKLSLYYSKNLDENIKKTKSQNLTKTDCTNLFYNVLTATNKEGVVYATKLGYTLDASGEVDYLSLVNKEMEGPIIAGIGWESQLPFSADKAIFYRNSLASSKASIQLYDVLYYSETMNTVWAFSDKVSGTVESISPDQLSPTSVIIAGNTLTLGTQEMSFAFSTLGTVKEGDVITALLGKDGSVVGVLTESEYTASVNGTVIEAGEKISSLNSNKVYLCNYLTVVDAAGRTYTVEYSIDEEQTFVEGGIVTITYSDDKANVDYCYQRYDDPIQGTVNASGTSLGSYALAKDIHIIDTQGSQYKTVYASRIAGMQLYTSEILYYGLNKNGEISELILRNTTGDLDTYGILKSIDYGTKGTTLQNTYNYLVGGEEKTYTSTELIVSLIAGPVKISYDGADIDNLSSLYYSSISSITGTKVKTSDGTLILSDQVVVYYLEDSKYNLTTLNKVSDFSQYYLTAYYDNILSRGGRVRVIIAQDKQ